MSSQNFDTQIIFVNRWEGTPDIDWYPWIKEEFPKKHPNILVNVLDMPQPTLPTIQNWVPVAEAALKKAKIDGFKKIFIVGHSVGKLVVCSSDHLIKGCQTVIRALDNLKSADNTFTVDGVLLVAAWFIIDNPWPTIKPWIETPVNTQNVANTTSNFHVILSDNDQFTADWLGNKKLWEERISHSHVHIISGAKHFNATQEPAVLTQLEKLIS